VPYLRTNQPALDGQSRIELALAAIEDLPSEVADLVSVSDIEVNRAGATYTIDTVNQLRKAYPQDRFTLIMGSDAAASFDKWYRVDSLRKIVELLVVKRPGEMPLGNELKEISINALDISATQVRAAIATGADLTQLLSPSVVELINERGLYGRK
jgi:nicotinate-nucleotide adenylyltransferase